MILEVSSFPGGDPNNMDIQRVTEDMEGKEHWDASTSWDVNIDVAPHLVEYVDDNIRSRMSYESKRHTILSWSHRMSVTSYTN